MVIFDLMVRWYGNNNLVISFIFIRSSSFGQMYPTPLYYTIYKRKSICERRYVGLKLKNSMIYEKPQNNVYKKYSEWVLQLKFIWLLIHRTQYRLTKQGILFLVDELEDKLSFHTKRGSPLSPLQQVNSFLNDNSTLNVQVCSASPKGYWIHSVLQKALFISWDTNNQEWLNWYDFCLLSQRPKFKPDWGQIGIKNFSVA